MDKVRDYPIIRIAIVFNREIQAADKAHIQETTNRVLSQLFGFYPNRIYFKDKFITCELKSTGSIIDSQDLVIYALALEQELGDSISITEMLAEGRDQYDKKTFHSEYKHDPWKPDNNNNQQVILSPPDAGEFKNQDVIEPSISNQDLPDDSNSIEISSTTASNPVDSSNAPPIIVDLTTDSETNISAEDLAVINAILKEEKEGLLEEEESQQTIPQTLIPDDTIDKETQDLINSMLQEDLNVNTSNYPASTNPVLEAKVDELSFILLEFDEKPWKKSYEARIVNVIQHTWERSVGNSYKISKIVGVGGKTSTYRIEFIDNAVQKFPIKFIVDMVNILALVEPEIYQYLVSIYCEGTTAYGPCHRKECESTHAALLVDDEICMDSDELQKVAKFLFPNTVTPHTRLGCVELLKTKLGANQNAWTNTIMLNFYNTLWNITQGEKPFMFKDNNVAKRFFEKEKIMTHESQVWPVVIETSYPDWQISTVELFGNMSIGDIHLAYLEMTAIVKNSLLPILYTPKGGWLTDSEINDALVPYSNNPAYHFQHYMVRLPYGDAAKDNAFNPLDTQYLGNTAPYGITKFSFIINADQVGSGTHWIVFFTDIESLSAYYLDSFARKPNPSVRKAITSALNLLKIWFPNFNKSYKDVQHLANSQQSKGSECGVYAVMYSVELAKGVPFQTIDDSFLPDEQVETYRNIFWRKP